MAGKRISEKTSKHIAAPRDTFAEELSRYIEKSGMTIQKLSAVTGLGRTAIQHTIAGKLVPAKNFIDRLCAALPMTPEQRDELTRRYAREKAGEAAYYNRSRIKQIIETLPQYRISDRITDISVGVDSLKNCTIKSVSGLVNVNSLLRTVLLAESSLPSPKLITAIPFDYTVFFEMLLQIFSASRSGLCLEHYFRMYTCAEGEKNINLDILQGALKIAMCAAIDYSPYYHYANREAVDCLLTAYPYFMISSDFSVLVSSDFSAAVLIGDKELREELIRHSERIRSRSSLMITRVGQAEMFGVFANCSPYFYSSIEYQPCLTAYVNEDILQRRLGDVPHREDILRTVREKFFDTPNMDTSRYKNYFTKEGLISFAKTGKMTNMPGFLLEPMSREERIYFLESMKADSGSYIMLSEDFAVPSFMQVICLTNRTVIISCITEEIKFCCLLTEPGLCGAFEDLIDSLGDSGLTENVGIFTAVIDSCIEMIKKSDEEDYVKTELEA